MDGLRSFPSSLHFYILNDFVGDWKDIVHFDTALCHRNHRQDYLYSLHKEGQFHIRWIPFTEMAMAWFERRKIRVNSLHYNLTQQKLSQQFKRSHVLLNTVLLPQTAALKVEYSAHQPIFGLNKLFEKTRSLKALEICSPKGDSEATELVLPALLDTLENTETFAFHPAMRLVELSLSHLEGLHNLHVILLAKQCGGLRQLSVAHCPQLLSNCLLFCMDHFLHNLESLTVCGIEDFSKMDNLNDDLVPKDLHCDTFYSHLLDPLHTPRTSYTALTTLTVLPFAAHTDAHFGFASKVARRCPWLQSLTLNDVLLSRHGDALAYLHTLLKHGRALECLVLAGTHCSVAPSFLGREAKIVAACHKHSASLTSVELRTANQSQTYRRTPQAMVAVPTNQRSAKTSVVRAQA